MANLMGCSLLPLMTPHPGSIPRGQGAQASKRGLLPVGASPASCSQGARCQAGTAPEVGALTPALFSRSQEHPVPWEASSPPAPGCPPPRLSRHSQPSWGVLWWSRRGLGCRAGGNLFRFPSSQPLPQRARRFGPVSRAVCCPCCL